MVQYHKTIVEQLYAFFLHPLSYAVKLSFITAMCHMDYHVQKAVASCKLCRAAVLVIVTLCLSFWLYIAHHFHIISRKQSVADQKILKRRAEDD